MLYGGIDLPGCPDPENVRKLDLLPLNQIRRMQRVGVAIDREHLWALSERLESKRQDLKKQITSFIPPDRLDQFVGESDDDLTLNVDSAEKIADLLYKELGIGIGRRLKRTKSGKRLSTGKKQLETLKRDHPVIPLILEYREASKLKTTYADALPKLARWCQESGTWRVHTELPTTRTDTSRLASKNPNLQNIPIRTKLGAEIRKAFVASPGKKLVSVDYAQIEMRLMAHLANDPQMIRIFSENGDIHTDTAMRAFNIDDPSKVDKMLHRAPCKNIGFGVAYGLGPIGLLDLMAVTYATAGLPLPDEIDLEWCERFIEKWFGLYPKMHEYFELQHYRARRYQITWCMFGGVRRIPEVRSCHDRVVAAGLRQAGNNPIQRGAAGVMKIGMARCEDRVFEPMREMGIGAEALLPIHDELLSEVDEDWADKLKMVVEREMARALVEEDGKRAGELRCRVPILTDGKVMDQGWEKG